MEHEEHRRLSTRGEHSGKRLAELVWFSVIIQRIELVVEPYDEEHENSEERRYQVIRTSEANHVKSHPTEPREGINAASATLFMGFG